MRPPTLGCLGSVRESADDRAGRGLRPLRNRTESESESDRHHLREIGGLPAAEDVAIGGELFAAEFSAPQDPQEFEGVGIGARWESFRDETVYEPGWLRHLHGTLHGGEKEDVLGNVICDTSG